MAVRETIQVGDPRLKAENKAVTDFGDPKTKQVIDDLIDSLRSKELLVGLSAPQIGENFKIFVTEPRETKFRTADQSDELRIYINPKIIKSSLEESIAYEGCGSFANAQIFGPVKRPKEITIEATGQNGKKFQLSCDGILARVIQHEYDHLNGIEFIEKITDYKKLTSAEFYIRDIKMSKAQTTASVITKKTVKYL
ncbi:MAG: peptide deformylase [Patescibacteria group bacterium]|jgi:peptide deformylase